ncbi:MAG TPA: response regulator [Thermodesulfobacteriota bacterium]|mgnify:CR=1 FL=1|nr:response regulator [Deltaproteobacteria bacterium]HNR12573.1 response regulator [Thermodesulfobacteriota bacterium]HNU71492.1 response regulator [Thermodesulfobacteriota bacterium]
MATQRTKRHEKLLLQGERRIRDLVLRLVKAESAIQSSLGGKIDAVLDPLEKNPLLLRQAQEALLTEMQLRRAEERLRCHLKNDPLAVIEWNSRLRIVRWEGEAERIFGWGADEVLGRHPSEWSFIHEEDLPNVKSGLEQLLTGDQSRNLTATRIYRKDGGMIQCEWYSSALFDEEGIPISILTRILDVTERKQMEDYLKKSKERFELLAEVASRLLSTDNPQAIVNDLCERVMQHLNCQAFFNYLVDERHRCLRLNAFSGIPMKVAESIEQLQYGAAICGCAAQERARIVAEDILAAHDARTDLVRSYGIRAYACHPLMSGNRVIGTLSFGTCTRPAFMDDELSLMKAVADQVALAVERKQNEETLRHSKESLEEKVLVRTAALRQSEEQLRYLSNRLLGAQEDERKLVAMDLHDSIAAALSAIKMQLQRLSAEKDKTASVQQPLVEVVGLVDGTIAEVRRIMVNLRPSMLDDLGLLPTIRHHCREFQKLYPKCRVSVMINVTEADIPQHLRIVIFRVLQEALNNVGKHSQATTVETSLGKEDDQLSLAITDDGCGFSVRTPQPTAKTGSGFGLSSMHERVRLSGGSFVVLSSPGKGTAIRAYWPQEHTAEALLATGAASTVVSHCPQVAEKPQSIRKVLLVEDNKVFRQAFKDALLAQFPLLHIEETAEGWRALEIVRLWQPQLIFMDIHLPGETGLVLTRKVKQVAPETNVVMLTSYDTAEYRQAAAEAGACGFLVKGSWNMEEVAAFVADQGWEMAGV